MTERVKMKYVSCPACGKQLLKVSGNCSVEITCSRCRKEIVGVVDEIYMRIFERHGWSVQDVYLDNPMRHDEKYLLINQGFSRKQRLTPYFNRQMLCK